MEKRIFISHSSKDHEVASKICEALEENGLKCWIAPRDIPYGTQWAGEISKAIENSSAFLFLSSGSSNASEQVSREIQLAIENSLTIIPIRLDGTQYSDANKYYLATIHCMIEYDAAKTHKLVEDIMEALPEPQDEPAKARSRQSRKPANHNLRVILASLLTVLCAVLFVCIFFFTSLQDIIKYITAAVCLTAALTPLLFFRKKALSSYNVKRIKINILSVTAIIAAAGIVTGGYFLEQHIWLSDKDSKYFITLSAPSTMSASDFTDTVEHVRTRFDILMGDERYSFRQEGDRIEIVAPRSAFGGLDPANVIKCYISREIRPSVTSTTAYIGEYTEDFPELVSFSHEQIKDMSIKHGTVEGADTEALGITTESYDYIELVLDEGFVKDNADTFSEYGDKLVIAQDKEAQITNYFYHHTYRSEKDNIFYLINTDNLPNANDLIIHNFTNPPLADSLNVGIEIAVKWETTEDISEKGKNQCNSDEFDVSTATFSYLSSDKETSEGEWLDTKKILKERLDAMNTPYAFGRLENDDKSIAVKLPVESTGLYIAELLTVDRFYVRGSYSCSAIPLSPSSPELKALREDGSYAIEVKASYDDTMTEYAGLNKLASDEGDGRIYLTFGIDNIPVLSAEADSGSDGSKIIFDRIALLDNIPAAAEHEGLINLIEKIYSSSLPADIKFNDYRFDNEATKESDFGYSLKLDEIEAAMKEIDPSAKVEIAGTIVRILFDMPVSEELPQQVINRAKLVFEKTDFENSCIPYIGIFFIEEIDDERARIFFRKNINTYYPGKDYYENGYINTHGIFSGGRIQRDNEVFLEMIYNDEFFKKYIKESEGSKAFS